MIRFGLGRRGGEDPPPDPAAWLAGQLNAADPALSASGHSAADGLEAIRERRRMKDGQQGTPIRDIFRADAAASFDAMLTTTSPFRERLVWFWANHFTVSTRRAECAALTGAFVREAIRPHVTGRFADMLFAVMRHPAMLLYLDNAQSIGPESPAGSRQRRGLNENLARESLELHTVSSRAGYTQADVTEYAKILTGWSIAFDYNPPGFLFRLNAHEPGPKTVMGQNFAHGLAGGNAILTWLADHPATHRHLATKLVRHFVADDPPPALVWQPLTKLRSPADYAVAVLRALDLPDDKRPNLLGVLAGLGQPFCNAPLPNGWPDTAADWAGPEAIMRRVDWAFGVAGRAEGLDPEQVAQTSLGPLLGQPTIEAMRLAGSRRDAFTLLLASAEFQRR
jgi:uncharacterized protein (DUF1800 family)